MNELIHYNNNLLSYSGNLLTPVYSSNSRIRFLFKNCTHAPTDYTDWYSYDPSTGYTPWVHIKDDIWDYYPIDVRYASKLSTINEYEFTSNGNPNITPQPATLYGLLTKDRFGSNAEIYILSYNCKASLNSHTGVFYKNDAIYSASNVSFLFNESTSITFIDAIGFFDRCTNLRYAININASNARYITGFFNCSIGYEGNLVEVSNFNTSNVIYASALFTFQYALTEVPLLDTSSMTDVRNMFLNCKNVTHGALALYTQMSNQTNPPSNYSDCFYHCGSNTTTGAAELAQIPSSWGGTGA